MKTPIIYNKLNQDNILDFNTIFQNCKKIKMNNLQPSHYNLFYEDVHKKEKFVIT